METAPEITRREGYHHGDLRAHLVEAARQLVEAKGPDRFSVSEACRVAGVSTAAPYRHFKDKDEMLVAVAAGGMHRQLENMLAAAGNHAMGTAARINGLGRGYVDFARREPGVFCLIFGLTRDHADRDELISRGREIFEMVCTEVAAVLGHRPPGEDAIQRAFQLWSFVHGLSFLLIDDKLDRMGIEVDVDAHLVNVGGRILAN